jgi:aryl-alcohol dehydrogenase-like predicted oxidoreductase
MREVQLGRTGMRVTEFIFGAGSIGESGSSGSGPGGGMTDVEALARLDEAFARGIRVIDTANSYGGGDSERAIGRWLESRNDMLITTKVGSATASSAADGEDATDLSHDTILEAAKASRERLGRFELYLTHAPDGDTPVAETIQAMNELVADGITHAWGCSNITAEQLKTLLTEAERLGVRAPGWVQNEFSLLVRDDEVQSICSTAGLGYTGYSPLAGGILAGGVLSDLDIDRSPAVQEAVSKLDSLAKDRGTSASSLALWWLRWHPSVTATIVSPRLTTQWEAVDRALALDDDAALRSEIDGIFAPVVT